MQTQLGFATMCGVLDWGTQLCCTHTYFLLSNSTVFAVSVLFMYRAFGKQFHKESTNVHSWFVSSILFSKDLFLKLLDFRFSSACCTPPKRIRTRVCQVRLKFVTSFFFFISCQVEFVQISPGMLMEKWYVVSTLRSTIVSWLS